MCFFRRLWWLRSYIVEFVNNGSCLGHTIRLHNKSNRMREFNGWWMLRCGIWLYSTQRYKLLCCYYRRIICYSYGQQRDNGHRFLEFFIQQSWSIDRRESRNRRRCISHCTRKYRSLRLLLHNPSTSLPHPIKNLLTPRPRYPPSNVPNIRLPHRTI